MGAGLPEAAAPGAGREARTGFLAAPAEGAAHPRVSVTWQEGGKSSDGRLDRPSEELRLCEQALRRAGFRVEFRAEAAGGCLLAWRGLQVR
jgi:hypothetical protein